MEPTTEAKMGRRAAKKHLFGITAPSYTSQGTFSTLIISEAFSTVSKHVYLRPLPQMLVYDFCSSISRVIAVVKV